MKAPGDPDNVSRPPPHRPQISTQGKSNSSVEKVGDEEHCRFETVAVCTLSSDKTKEEAAQIDRVRCRTQINLLFGEEKDCMRL